MSQVDETLFDVRYVERFIAEGRVTREQYDAWLATVEDCAKQGEESAVRMQAVWFRSGLQSHDE
ncbi:MAG: hypothetical protein EXR69_12740 [Myxococcales bacterium]|nr:hypothetical protein [Myxococcales bacterium]